MVSYAIGLIQDLLGMRLFWVVFSLVFLLCTAGCSQSDQSWQIKGRIPVSDSYVEIG